MRIDGSCHCGAITYDADINPDYVVMCHCTDCQTFSGAPYRVSVIRVRPHDFRLHGTPKTYIKTGRSGGKVLLGFCGECGTALYSTSPGVPDSFNLRIGAIKQRRELTPRAQGFCDSALSWAYDITSIRKIPEPKRTS